MKVFFAAPILFAACIFSHHALAFGALSVAEPSDVANDGYPNGIAYNFKTAPEAEERAQHECAQLAQGPAKTRKECKIVRTFENQCVVVALDPVKGTPGAGWSVADTLVNARREALERCEQTAGAPRRGECRISAEGCDGKAK